MENLCIAILFSTAAYGHFSSELCYVYDFITYFENYVTDCQFEKFLSMFYRNRKMKKMKKIIKNKY